MYKNEEEGFYAGLVYGVLFPFAALGLPGSIYGAQYAKTRPTSRRRSRRASSSSSDDSLATSSRARRYSRRGKSRARASSVSSCGYASSKWLGRCPECGEWNSLVEEAAQSGKPAGAVTSTREAAARSREVEVDHAPRMQTGIGELDRVLGGGLVAGLAGAARRRSRDRQVDAAAAGARRRGARGQEASCTSRARSRCSRRRCAPSGSACGTELAAVLAETAARAHPRRGGGDASRRCWPSTRCRRCIRRSWSRSRDRSARCARPPGGCSRSPRPKACRWCSSATSPRTAALAGPEDARARGRLRALLRGRAQPHLPRPARDQEPLRLDQRDRRLRDARRRARRGRQPVGAVPGRAAGRRAGLGGRRRRSRARGRSSSRSRRWWRTRRACRGARRSASIPTACRSCSR